MVDIPAFIKQSGVFTEEDLIQLANAEALPSEEEIDAFQYDSEIQELLNAFIGDDTTRLTHQLLKAKEFIAKGEINKAWKIALF